MSSSNPNATSQDATANDGAGATATQTNPSSKKKTSKKKKEDLWEHSLAKKLLKKALVRGSDEKGNRVCLRSADGAGAEQMPRNIYLLFKDLPEFQISDFNDEAKFKSRLYNLRKAVTEAKKGAHRDKLALENSLLDHPIPNMRQFVDVALPFLRADMDAGKHELMKPRYLHKTRPEYMEFELEKFRKHIHQEVYTRKACIQYKWKIKNGLDVDALPKPEIVDLDELYVGNDDDGDTDDELEE